MVAPRASAKAFFRLVRRARRSKVVCDGVSTTRLRSRSIRVAPPAALANVSASSAVWL